MLIPCILALAAPVKDGKGQPVALEERVRFGLLFAGLGFFAFLLLTLNDYFVETISNRRARKQGVWALSLCQLIVGFVVLPILLFVVLGITVFAFFPR